MRKNLLIMEGPAGSGKSTLIKKLREPSSNFFIEPVNPLSFNRPRTYDGIDGLQLAQLKDGANVVNALYTRSTELDQIIIDRGFISAAVYGYIRATALGREVSLPTSVAMMVSSLFVRLMQEFADAKVRNSCEMDLIEGHPLGEVTKLCSTFVVLVPSARVLRYTRAQAEANGRKYPYDVDTEVEAYTVAASAAMSVVPSMLEYVLSSTQSPVDLSYDAIILEDDDISTLDKRALRLIRQLIDVEARNQSDANISTLA